ncbi:MAG TPA: GlsB/YeaQ/YmgE family stress response membrane protein [Caulobacteraceae bacterium]|jgi:uncharacterized membrane protein YeaQ/YmgE (transglycosylase-associated protein family)|nr:GlsB/YeaQ/YmgE family stress response membrane protein [Caulobacteraceae bacterium]
MLEPRRRGRRLFRDQTTWKTSTWKANWKERPMSIIAWLVLGLIAGFIASKIVNQTGSGIIMDIVIGVIGSFIGGFVFTRFFGAAGVTGFNLYSLFVAVIGAIVLLLIYHLIIGRRRPLT